MVRRPVSVEASALFSRQYLVNGQLMVYTISSCSSQRPRKTLPNAGCKKTACNHLNRSPRRNDDEDDVLGEGRMAAEAAQTGIRESETAAGRCSDADVVRRSNKGQCFAGKGRKWFDMWCELCLPQTAQRHLRLYTFSCEPGQSRSSRSSLPSFETDDDDWSALVSATRISDLASVHQPPACSFLWGRSCAGGRPVVRRRAGGRVEEQGQVGCRLPFKS